MPIPRENFNKTKTSLEDRIIQLLKKNKDKAFTIIEIITEIEEIKNDALLVFELYYDQGNPKGLKIKYKTTMDELLSRQLIEMAEIGGKVYFAIKE
ncbi:MAG: hypothetical protein FJ088_02825 [Deltaproteobacteria bacterium]|nr:hypothetical protein [Deltaproteobacteria bacterium]